jgi:hypothetical protein
MIWLLAHPPPPRPETHGRLRKKENMLTEEGEGQGAESYDRKKAWSSINFNILFRTLLASNSCVVLVVQLAAGLDHAEGSATHATSLRGHKLRGIRQRQDQHALRVPAERGHALHAVPRHLDPGGAHAGAAHARALGDGAAHHFRSASGALCRHTGGVQNVREQDNIERFIPPAFGLSIEIGSSLCKSFVVF